jgi:putative oxidoreductase
MDRKLQHYWPISLRVLLGIGFMVHGFPKVFSGAGHAGFASMLQQIGVPAPGLMAWVVGIVEYFGGIALVLGLATWLVSALLIVDMLVAMFTVHLAAGFSFLQVMGTTPEGAPIFGMPGAEVNLLYLAGLLALFVGGPGPLSVDERIKGRALHLPWHHREVHA